MIKDIFVYIDRDVSLTIDSEIKMPMCFLLIILTARYHVSGGHKGGTYDIRQEDQDYIIDVGTTKSYINVGTHVVFRVEYNGNMWYVGRYTNANIFIDNYSFVDGLLIEGNRFVPEWEQFNLVDVIKTSSPENGDSHSDIGQRETMEDTHLYERRNIVKFYMIADGHGGSRTSKYLHDNLANIFFKNIEKSIKNSLETTFLQIDQRLFDNQIQDGSTCLVSVIVNKNFYFANLGDSRGILVDVTDNKIVLQTRDHKPTDPEESKRITKAGGQVLSKRVQGRLAVSRAFGDNEFKTRDGKYQGQNAPVSPVPDVYRYTMNPSHRYILVMACDGLWDVCSNIEVRDMVVSGSTSRDIVDFALKKGSTDNVSVMIDRI